MLNEVMIANKNYASVVVEDKGRLDKTALNVIRYDCPSFLLPIRLVSINNEIQLRYEILGGIRLAYMSLQMKKQELNQMLYQLLMPYTECADWFLDFHNIYLDRNYIMVDQSDMRVKYIYMPYGSNIQTEEQIMRFFCDLVMDVELQDDQAYITTLLRSIMGKDASLTAFAELIQSYIKDKDAQPTPVSEQKQQPVSVQVSHQVNTSPVLSDRAEEKKEPVEEFGVNDLAGSIGAGLFGESGGSTDKKTKKKVDKKADKKEKQPKEKPPKEKSPKEGKGLFGMLRGGDKKAKKGEAESKQADSMDGTEVLGTSAAAEMNAYRENSAQIQQGFGMDDFRTEIYDEEEPAAGMLRLRLETAHISNIPSTIDLDMRNGYAVIGRYDKTGKLSADFNFDMSLTFIGRRHARFEMSGSDMYIIDLESKNHTYLNSEELLPNRRYPLHKGDRIMLTQKYGIIYRVC